MTNEVTCPAPTPSARRVLTLNGGSSSIKFAVFESGDSSRLVSGAVEKIGRPDAFLRTKGFAGRTEPTLLPASDPIKAAGLLLDWLEDNHGFEHVTAVGHRIVHGGPDYVSPTRVDTDLLNELRRLIPLDPAHLPAEIALIEAVTLRRPDLPQIACFDTDFHKTLPPVAQLLPIPRRYVNEGIRRYGFHGLSYAFLLEELRRIAGPEEANGRVVLAHLGAGASLAAVRGGVCVDTTMGFTPTGGLVMGTRTGDLDPGVLVHLMRTENFTADKLDVLVNRESGLLGVSETSSDMRDLLAREQSDARAADAVALFCYQAKKFIGAMATVLGGIDTLVFSGGVGENAAVVRSRICANMEFLGVQIDKVRNENSEIVISADGVACKVRVIRTDEEVEIARIIGRVLGSTKNTE